MKQVGEEAVCLVDLPGEGSFIFTRCGNLRFQPFGGRVGRIRSWGASLGYWREKESRQVRGEERGQGRK